LTRLVSVSSRFGLGLITVFGLGLGLGLCLALSCLGLGFGLIMSYLTSLRTYLLTYLLTVVQIQFWRAGDPNDVRSTDILTGPEADICPPLNIYTEQRRRRRRQAGSSVHGAVDDLWPYSTITAGVLVLNQGSAGSLSDTIDFETPAGGTVPCLPLVALCC